MAHQTFGIGPITRTAKFWNFVKFQSLEADNTVRLRDDLPVSTLVITSRVATGYHGQCRVQPPCVS